MTAAATDQNGSKCIGAVAGVDQAAVTVAADGRGSAPELMTDDVNDAAGGGSGRVKGPWSPEEDVILGSLVAKLGARNWGLIARGIPGRSGKSCRLRWCNQLDPGVTRKPFTGTLCCPFPNFEFFFRFLCISMCICLISSVSSLNLGFVVCFYGKHSDGWCRCFCACNVVLCNGLMSCAFFVMKSQKLKPFFQTVNMMKMAR